MPGGNKAITPADGKQFSKDYRPANPGRKPTKYLTEALKNALDSEKETLVTGISTTTGLKDTVKVKLPGFHVLIMSMVQGAIKAAAKGDTRGAKEIFDRIEGKVMQGVELTGADGGPIEVKKIERVVTFRKFDGTQKAIEDAEEVEDDE